MHDLENYSTVTTIALSKNPKKLFIWIKKCTVYNCKWKSKLNFSVFHSRDKLTLENNENKQLQWKLRGQMEPNTDRISVFEAETQMVNIIFLPVCLTCFQVQ